MDGVRTMKKESKKYGIILKIDWTEILSIFSKKKGHLSFIEFGTDVHEGHYVDLYILILGVGLGIRGSFTEEK